MLKKLFTHSLIYSLAPQAPKIASLVLLPVITRHLTAIDYGVYGLITSYLFFVTALRDLGFGVVFVNTFYKHKERWPIIWRMLHGHLIIWNIFYLFIMLALLKIAIPVSVKGYFWLIAGLTIIPAVIFENTNLLGNYYYRFSQKPVFIAIVSIVTGIVSVLVTYVSIVSFHLGYMGWFIASFVSALTTFLFYFYPVYIKLKLFPVIRFRRKFIMPYLRVALPMVPHNYSSYLLNSSDRVVMDMFKINIGQIGIYNIAYSFGNYFESLGEAIGMAVGPFYSKLYTTNNNKSYVDERRLTFFLMSGFLTITFLVSVWLKEIFQILISNVELQSGYGIGVIIIMGYAYRPMYWSVGIKLSIFEKTSILWRISFVAGLLNVVLNVLFVPRFGIAAAALSTLLSLLYIGFSGYYFKAVKKMNGLNHYPFYWMLAIVLLTTTAFLVKDIMIPAKVIITIVVVLLTATFFYKNYAGLKSIEV